MTGRPDRSPFADRVRRLARALEGLGQGAWRSSGHISRDLIPGEFRSLHRFPVGFERDVPRAFTLDDDTRHIDTRRIPPSLAIGTMADAILRGEMRLIQSIHFAESEFTLIVDLSRSMLSCCNGGGDPTGYRQPSTTKWQALFFAACAYLTMAEATRFALRTIFVRGRSPDQVRSRTPRDFMPRVLAAMTDHLVESHAWAEADPDSREGFLLGSALMMAGAAKARGVVVVISDFLDPLYTYSDPLCLVLARHHAILVDVASPPDYDFYVPRWYEFDALLSDTSRDGARHLEEGTRNRRLDPASIRAWNHDRQADRSRLAALAKRFGVAIVPSGRASLEDCYVRAMQAFGGLV